MGGDGGTIGANRRYMRGAGTADHTADHTRHHHPDTTTNHREYAAHAMKTCALTGSPLLLDPKANAIVACPYGRLYGREAAVEALLRRKQQHEQEEEEGEQDAGDRQGLGRHIRGLKDLFPVRFQLSSSSDDDDEKSSAVCPITGTELNGTQPAFLIVQPQQKKKKKKDKHKKKTTSDDEETSRPNVVSERVLKEMPIDELQTEFGPFVKEDMIRLVPQGDVLEEIKLALWRKRDQDSAKKKEGKKDKKRKTHPQPSSSTNEIPHKKPSLPTSNNQTRITSQNQAVALAKANAASAVAKSAVLTELFSNERSRSQSEKEKKDSLFVR